MTPHPRRTRVLAPALTIALAAGLAGLMAAPATAATSTFASTTDIFVDDSSYEAVNSAPIAFPQSGTATPYPSPINITHAARITDLNVTLFDLSHAFPDDIDIMLV